MQTKTYKNPNLKLFFRLISFSPSYFPIYTLSAIFSEIAPAFFNIWASGEIVNALTAGENVWRIVLIALIGNLLIAVGNGAFSSLEEIGQTKLWIRQNLALNKKMLSLDYAQLGNAEIRALRDKIKRNDEGPGYGTWYVGWHSKTVIRIVIKLIVACFLLKNLVVGVAGYGLTAVSGGILGGIAASILLNILWGRYSVKLTQKAAIKDDAMFEPVENAQAALTCDGKEARLYPVLPILTGTFSQALKNWRPFFKKYMLLGGIEQSGKEILDMLLAGLGYWFVGYYVTLGVFPIGSMLQFVGYFLQLIQNIAWFFGTIVKFKINVPFANDFLSFFDIQSEMKMGTIPVEKRSDRRFEISLDHVTFRYPDSNKEALRDVSLKIRTGERLALVGMNGSGKTTLIKLLCRLYDPTGGKIVMNDFDIKNYDYDEYQGLFSLTFQDFHLFPFTIGQNVAAGKAYQPERCEEILRSVDFGKRLDELPAGLETHLYKDFDSDGVEISGGEGQKIALARAVYHDTPFIILDEPTAALDPSSEAKIYKSFDQITGGKTTIYISHRLSSCRFCDRIAVLDEGKLVQLGTHEELLADTEGKYAELWNAQAQYYKE